jgi:hypothetical protein
MSHVAVQETKPGEPLFADVDCLKAAAELLGCRLVKRNTYAWYGRHVGDYPMPKGMTAEQLGKNAEYVIEATEEGKAKAGVSGGCYDVGIVPDANNPGAYVPIYDFYGQLHGIDRLLGSPVREGGRVTGIVPKLLQHYHMICDARAAQEAGDKVEFLTAADAHSKYPALFPTPTQDTDTWVSIVDTSHRVAATLG